MAAFRRASMAEAGFEYRMAQARAQAGPGPAWPGPAWPGPAHAARPGPGHEPGLGPARPRGGSGPEIEPKNIKNYIALFLEEY